MAQDKVVPKPHVSVSQLNTFLLCPLKYKFRYVDQLPPERLSLALPFGQAMHRALSYLFFCQKHGADSSLANVLAVFREEWENVATAGPIVFEEGEKERLQAQGIELLTLVHREATAEQITVEEVEEEFRVPILNPETGEVIDSHDLVGIFDLVRQGEPSPTDGAGGIIVEHKTASRVYDKTKVEMDLQMTAYSYAYRLWFKRREEALEYRLMVKTKQPKLQRIKTQRSEREHAWLFHLIKNFLIIKELGLFHPNPGWQCAECEYRTACQQWQGK